MVQELVPNSANIFSGAQAYTLVPGQCLHVSPHVDVWERTTAVLVIFPSILGLDTAAGAARVKPRGETN